MSETETYTDESLLELFDEQTVDQLEDTPENFRALRRAHRALKKETHELGRQVQADHDQLRTLAVKGAGFDPQSKQAKLLIDMASEDSDADPFAAGTYSELAEAIGMQPVAPPEQSDDDTTESTDHDEEV